LRLLQVPDAAPGATPEKAACAQTQLSKFLSHSAGKIGLGMIRYTRWLNTNA
jgi:hypothetical protein